MTSTGADEARARLVERVRELAYLHSPDDPFTLASGRISPHFFDMKPVMMNRLLMPNLKRLTPIQMRAKRKANKPKQKNRSRDWLRFFEFSRQKWQA